MSGTPPALKMGLYNIIQCCKMIASIFLLLKVQFTQKSENPLSVILLVVLSNFRSNERVIVRSIVCFSHSINLFVLSLAQNHSLIHSIVCSLCPSDVLALPYYRSFCPTVFLTIIHSNFNSDYRNSFYQQFYLSLYRSFILTVLLLIVHSFFQSFILSNCPAIS